jgi:hypothetical protein
MPLINTDLTHQFDSNIRKYSLSFAAKKLLSSLNLSIKSNSVISLNSPTLFVSNHPGGLDIFLIQAAIQDPELHFVALASYEGFSDVIKEKLIPIYRRSSWRDVFPRLFTNQLRSHQINDTQKVRELNKLSIKKAANLINQGKSVVIFPTGTGGRKPSQSNWKAGVGHLISQIKNSDTRVCFIHITNSSKYDWLRLIFYHFGWKRFKRKIIQVNLLGNFKLAEYVNTTEDAKKIAKYLESKYQNLLSHRSQLL